MKNHKTKTKILAPAGSYESLMAAINAGANAVYFGVGKLNMRSRSSNNFDSSDLIEIAKICKKNNVETYLTVNTIIYDSEIAEMQNLLNLARESGISAIIASDISVLKYAKSIGIPVHASTQLNITNIEAVKFFSEYCDVIVTARELDLEQVNAIIDRIKKENITGPSGFLVKIEVFIHGALCMAVSGKCYLSLHEFNKSANRGECFQTCRRAYTVTDKESGYQLDIDNEFIMSPKDLKTIGFLNKILDAGVSVLKIEGRARSAEYVKTVVECYKQAVEAWQTDSFTQDKVDEWDKKLASVFNRGFWDGYYLGQKLGVWSSKYGSEATHRKVYLGKCRNYFGNIGVAEFRIETLSNLSLGDEILITGTTTGALQFTPKEFRIDDKPTIKLLQNDVFSFKTPEIIRRGDKLFKIVDAERIRQQ